MEDELFESDDKRFGIHFTNELIEEMYNYCRTSGDYETGGILIGYYTPDLKCSVVTKVEGPPRDSIFERATFVRGIYGIQKLISQLWKKKKQYYLGEWHFHPGGSVFPSEMDILQMETISNSKKWNCPEPNLTIVGANGEIGSYIFVRGAIGRRFISLKRANRQHDAD
jgi:integrative and conjugative element protein (TIGR02256 family)